ncbi:hypothetical protein GCM10010345_89910 [Streptomyces canarius]|uniref:Uncharacterized protein n=2 Tax=Streptomyces TaxID=1883 RepID=A0ABQ3DAS4_9ACTN|nr:hypothetical protein GCM10010345_89910 [Streptomyces canarius]
MRPCRPILPDFDTGVTGIDVETNDANDSRPDDSRIDNVSLHMEALKARMYPAQYDVLAKAVHETAHLIAEGHQAGPVGDASQFTDEVQREYATVLAILLTGRMDHRLVEMPGPDGSPGFAIVEASAADDPAKLQELREDHRRFVSEQQALYNELDGIARASGLSAD